MSNHDWNLTEGMTLWRFCRNCGMEQAQLKGTWTTVHPTFGPTATITGCDGEEPYVVPSDL